MPTRKGENTLLATRRVIRSTLNHAMQKPEITVQQAIEAAPVQAARLAALAAAHRERHTKSNSHDTVSHWESSARSYCYQTHVAVDPQPEERLDWLARVFYQQATLSSQPWYPQFLGGKTRALNAAPLAGISEHQLAWGCFDLGLSTPRYYRQLLSLAVADHATRVIVARSVDEGPELPDNARLAHTLSPNGEVLHFENGRLHWHHICCTPGAGLLPGRLDRWLINTLRRMGLDRAERKTYREEAERLQSWLATPATGFAGDSVSQTPERLLQHPDE